MSTGADREQSASRDAGCDDPNDPYTEVDTGGAEPQGQSPATAVLVCHGMGQQVPFETLDLVARGLYEVEAANDPAPAKIRAGYVRLAQRKGDSVVLPRAQLTLATGHRVDVFEAYWAPLTEGKVKARDVLWFLVTGGLQGVWYSWVTNWQRWMFGRIACFRIPRWQLLAFTAAFAVVFSLVFVTLVTAAVTAAHFFTPTPGTWPPPPLLMDLTIDLWLFVLAGLLFGIGVKGLTGFLRFVQFTVRPLFPIGAPQRPMQAWHLHPLWEAIAWLCVGVALVGIVVAAVLVGLDLTQPYPDPPQPHWAARSEGRFPPGWYSEGIQLGTWLLVFAVTGVGRWFFVQFLGDVSAYVSAYSVNEYWEIRSRIKEESARVAQAIYGAIDPDTQLPLYPRVIMVGHSLGSVVAYDVLNQLLREDALAEGHGPWQAAERTPLFLTFGSPLDKTAFLFTARRRREAEVRETLAAATQPMIVDYRYRPARWVNIWSRRDWISGSLNYYDDEDAAAAQHARAKLIKDLTDPDARTPITAHNEYWRNALMRRTLYDAIVAPT
jgi:hypothetical protein